MRQGKSRWFTDKRGNRIKVTKNKNNTDYVKKPRLASTTTPGKSNVTATGQLLNALTVVKLRVKGAARFFFTVGDNRGRGLFDAPSTIGNKELLKILANQGRTWLGFTKSQINEIRRDVKAIIKKNIDK